MYYVCLKKHEKLYDRNCFDQSFTWSCSNREMLVHTLKDLVVAKIGNIDAYSEMCEISDLIFAKIGKRGAGTIYDIWDIGCGWRVLITTNKEAI